MFQYKQGSSPPQVKLSSQIVHGALAIQYAPDLLVNFASPTRAVHTMSFTY